MTDDDGHRLHQTLINNTGNRITEELTVGIMAMVQAGGDKAPPTINPSVLQWRSPSSVPSIQGPEGMTFCVAAEVGDDEGAEIAALYKDAMARTPWSASVNLDVQQIRLLVQSGRAMLAAALDDQRAIVAIALFHLSKSHATGRIVASDDVIWMVPGCRGQGRGAAFQRYVYQALQIIGAQDVVISCDDNRMFTDHLQQMGFSPVSTVYHLDIEAASQGAAKD